MIKKKKTKNNQTKKQGYCSKDLNRKYLDTFHIFQLVPVVSLSCNLYYVLCSSLPANQFNWELTLGIDSC